MAEEGGSPARTALWTVALAVVVATVALPPLGPEALMICLVLVGIQGVAALVHRSPAPHGLVTTCY